MQELHFYYCMSIINNILGNENENCEWCFGSLGETVHPWRHWPEKQDRNWWRETQLGNQRHRLLTCTIMSLPPLLSATVLWNLLMSSTISPLLVLHVLNLHNDAFYDYVIFLLLTLSLRPYVSYIQLSRAPLFNCQV